jgi:hypothetical protein
MWNRRICARSEEDISCGIVRVERLREIKTTQPGRERIFQYSIRKTLPFSVSGTEDSDRIFMGMKTRSCNGEPRGFLLAR